MVEGQRAISFQATDPTGKVWNFELSKRTRGHPKPVIRGDWLNYVHEKGIKVNEVIVLTREQDIQNGETYHIRVNSHKLSLLSVRVYSTSSLSWSLASSITFDDCVSSVSAKQTIEYTLCNADYGVEFLEFFVLCAKKTTSKYTAIWILEKTIDDGSRYHAGGLKMQNKRMRSMQLRQLRGKAIAFLGPRVDPNTKFQNENNARKMRLVGEGHGFAPS
ncbi:hypothetical protein POTOM_016587 [Populus tomentosa]|uniref:TF-B3 domain-containing protein n=1 Tax=Populus tomentosa TaxID=118781 RepID=A0A8X8D3E2_POPTO|nr:hypothetical protein POTOM_016587 [Populus tomentosa]